LLEKNYIMQNSQEKQSQLELFNENLKKLLNKEINTFRLDCLSIGDVEKILDDLGESHDDYDTNGWAHDYWSSRRINDQIITISGSGYYGGINIDTE